MSVVFVIVVVVDRAMDAWIQAFMDVEVQVYIYRTIHKHIQPMQETVYYIFQYFL